MTLSPSNTSVGLFALSQSLNGTEVPDITTSASAPTAAYVKPRSSTLAS